MEEARHTAMQCSFGKPAWTTYIRFHLEEPKEQSGQVERKRPWHVRWNIFGGEKVADLDRPGRICKAAYLWTK
jgi:hypothetical protein